MFTDISKAYFHHMMYVPLFPVIAISIIIILCSVCLGFIKQLFLSDSKTFLKLLKFIIIFLLQFAQLFPCSTRGSDGKLIAFPQNCCNWLKTFSFAEELFVDDV
ncbi:hypothetical protein ACKWTF_011451 [Chironomus riparius]